jgi:hypothetical protein
MIANNKSGGWNMNIQVGDLIEEADGSLSIITKIKLGPTTGKEYAECEFIINENDGDPLWSMGVEEITKQESWKVHKLNADA